MNWLIAILLALITIERLEGPEAAREAASIFPLMLKVFAGIFLIIAILAGIGYVLPPRKPADWDINHTPVKGCYVDTVSDKLVCPRLLDGEL